MAFGPLVKVEGDAELAAALAGIASDPALVKGAHKTVADLARDASRAVAAGGSPQQAREAGAIGSSASASAAVLKITNGASKPFAVGAFMGALQFHQFPAWVGANWDIEQGEGPYVIRDLFRPGAATGEVIKRTYQEEVAKRFEAQGVAVS